MKILLDYTVDTKYNEAFFAVIIEKIAEFAEFEPEAEVSIVLTDDETIHGLNLQWRGKDSATDVLSFPLEEKFMLGDIVISLETAARQAAELNIDVDKRVVFLFIHGFLHLLGFDHERSPEEADDMYDLQEEILKKWIDEKWIDQWEVKK